MYIYVPVNVYVSLALMQNACTLKAYFKRLDSKLFLQKINVIYICDRMFDPIEYVEI